MNVYLKNYLSDLDPGKALDLGAGDFQDVKALQEMGWECRGVDLNMGVDLNEPYFDKVKFDLVFSNYVLQKLDNKMQLIESAYNNLKGGGYFFLHTFHKSDKNSMSDIDEKSVKEMCEVVGFRDVKVRVFDYYDKEHRHWHSILEVTAEKLL